MVMQMFVYSISWAGWVPYALAGCSIFGVFVRPSICSIASKQVGPNEQGMVEGCLSGVSSMAQIVSPLIFSPLTALFLSEEAPFYFPGFSIMFLGLAMVVAFIQSLMIRAAPPIEKISSGIDTLDSKSNRVSCYITNEHGIKYRTIYFDSGGVGNRTSNAKHG
ncbi:uncharacterized protein [Arachis hypogaea]|uniref:uncharacterized protein n=1 Tax=Arachis hypogaea TaxID=3818 RepID=UPI003B214E2A